MGTIRVVGGSGQTGRSPIRRAPSRARLVLIAVMIALAGAGFGAENGRAAAGSAIVVADLLNLRAEPGTWAWVVAQMGSGEGLTVISGPTPDGWYQVEYGGLMGWAYGGYLLLDGAPGWGPIADQAAPGLTIPEGAAFEGAVATAAVAVDPAWTDPAMFPAAEPPGALPAAVATDPSLGVGGMGATSWVNQDDLKVLAGPNDQAGVVDALGTGDAVTVIGGPVDGFVPIQHWSGEAWVWNGALGQGAPAGPERWVDVSRSSQTVTLFEGDQVVASYWGSMGFDGSDAGFFATANGSYRVYEKYADLSWTTYGNAWVADWVAFDPNRLNGFHSYSMDSAGQVIPGGDGPTGGCIALAPWAADHLFSFLQLGSRVEVHW